jgi:PAS domain S-box-containing protein
LPEKELETARQTGRASDTRWHVRSDGRRFFADGVTTLLKHPETREIIGFSKFARDITERYAAERRLAAQLALSNILSTDLPIAAAARHVMQIICETLSWDIGALWRADGETLQQVDTWADPALAADAVQAVTSISSMQRGSGLPGRVFATGQPVWITDVRRDPNFPRAEILSRQGIQSAFAFPITNDGKTVGVMEFFTREARDPEQTLLPIMALIGAQVGDYFQRRRTAEALRASEGRYRVITETAQDAIFTIDKNSRILFANRKVKEMFGYEPSEIIGKPLVTIVPERLREAHQAGIERYLRTRKRHIPWNGIELPALHKDGHEFPVELAFGEFEDESGTIFSGFARDVTERTRAREELESLLAETQAARDQLQRRTEEEVSFRHLASALSGAAEMEDVLNEITGRATLVTRADAVYVERIASTNGDVEVVSAYGRCAPLRGTRVPYPGSLTEEILKGRSPVIMTDMRSFGRAMAPYLAERCGDCELLVTPLYADDEALGALVLLNSAVSGRHFSEADINRAQTLGDLSSLALRRVRLLEEERSAKEEAEAAVRVRDETLGIVSHDLRNPITTVALSAELLADASEEEQREHIEIIRTAARTMERLIQDLLDVARVESGRLSVQKVIVDPAEIARRSCDSHAAIAESKRIRLVCEIPELPPIEGDADRLTQVFANLIGNALKFTPAGGTITVRGSQDQKSVIFQVQDTGPGIPQSDLKKVFTPYWQAKKTAHMGAGLGLAIVRGIIDAHGGSISVTNCAAGGAEFTFRVPRASA